MLAEEAPAIALASGASLPPPSCDVLSDIVVGGHREVPARAGKPAREGVVRALLHRSHQDGCKQPPRRDSDDPVRLHDIRWVPDGMLR